MDADAFSTITEFAVALAGFSGIVVAIAHRGDTFPSIDRYRTLTLLAYSLSAAFGSLLPMAVESLGFSGDEVWRIAGAVLAVVLAASIVISFLGTRRLDEDDRAGLSVAVGTLTAGGNGLLIVWLVVNSLTLASPSPLVFALIWQLGLSSLQFVRLVLARRG
ncbi:hypothetical protein RHODOSMS8_00740 [Rhodobiaceae bacterium]|nr:hypothetical protein RHODOSMS8_00740 [Rhodobiaceae bacterium]